MAKASFETRLDVSGGEAIIANLKTLAPRLERKILRKSMRKGMTVIRDSARGKVRVLFGFLKKMLVVAEGDPRKYGGAVVMSVGVAKGSFHQVQRADGSLRFRRIMGKTSLGAMAQFQGKITPNNYAHQVENGTAPHDVGNGIQHPGSRPNPFFRPAIDEKKGEAFDVTLRTAQAEFDKAVTSK